MRVASRYLGACALIGMSCLTAFSLAVQPGGPATGGQPGGGAPAGTAQPGTPAPEPQGPEPRAVPEGPAVQTQELEGGLIIEDLVIGEGYEVKPGGAVVAYYHGTRKADGFVFDSAFQRGEPVAFPLGGVIPGWQKGVPGMKVGGVRRLTIPSALGYGERGAGGDIPPNTDLVFVIELVDALQIEDLAEGEGDPADGQFVAVTRTSYFDADGKPIDVPGDDALYVWIPGEMAAIDAGVAGMKVGGKRRLVVPKQMNIAPPQLPTARPQNVALTMELELVALRNLPGGRRR